jgi:hypothetical protein
MQIQAAGFMKCWSEVFKRNNDYKLAERKHVLGAASYKNLALK